MDGNFLVCASICRLPQLSYFRWSVTEIASQLGSPRGHLDDKWAQKKGSRVTMLSLFVSFNYEGTHS